MANDEFLKSLQKDYSVSEKPTEDEFLTGLKRDYSVSEKPTEDEFLTGLKSDYSVKKKESSEGEKSGLSDASATPSSVGEGFEGSSPKSTYTTDVTALPKDTSIDTPEFDLQKKADQITGQINEIYSRQDLTPEQKDAAVLPFQQQLGEMQKRVQGEFEPLDPLVEKTLGDEATGYLRTLSKGIGLGVADVLSTFDKVVQTAELGLADIVLDSEQMEAYKNLPEQVRQRPFKALSEAVAKTVEGVETQDNIAGGVIESIGRIAPEIMTAHVLPTVKAGQWLSKYGYKTVDKFTMFLAGRAGAEAAYDSQGKTLQEQFVDPLVASFKGGVEGTTYWMMGGASTGVAEKIGSKLFGQSQNAIRKIIEGTTGTVTNAFLFGGYEAAREYAETGEVSRDNVYQAIGVGLGLGIQNALVGRTVNSFIAADRAMVRRTMETKKSAEELKKQAVETMQEADRTADPKAKKEKMVEAAVLDNTANTKAVAEVILESPQQVKLTIDQSMLPEGAKADLKEKVDATVADNDPKLKKLKPVTDQMRQNNEKIAEIDGNRYIPEEVKQAQKKPLEEKNKELQSEIDAEFVTKVDEIRDKKEAEAGIKTKVTEENVPEGVQEEPSPKQTQKEKVVEEKVKPEKQFLDENNSDIMSASEFYEYFERNVEREPHKTSGIKLNKYGKPVQTNKSLYDKKVRAWNKKSSEAYAEYLAQKLTDNPNLSEWQVKDIAMTLYGKGKKDIAVKLLTEYGFVKNEEGRWVIKPGKPVSETTQKGGKTETKESAIPEVGQKDKAKTLKKETKVKAEPLKEEVVEKPIAEKQIAEQPKVEKPVAENVEPVTPTEKKISEKAKTIADTLRKGKIEDDILMSGIPFAKEAWNGAIETAAKTVELTGNLAQAISDGIKYLKNTEAYKSLSDENKRKVEAKFAARLDVAEKEGGIRHKTTAEMREESGLPQYERIAKTEAELNKQADQLIDGGYDVKNLIEKIEKGLIATDVEQTVLKRYIPSLKEAVAKSPTDENIAMLKRALDASDITGSEAGRALRARAGLIPVEETLADYMIRNMREAGVDKLTKEQKRKNTEEFEKITKLNEELQGRIKKLEYEARVKKAEARIRELQKERSGKKTHAQYTKERDAIRESIKAKWAKASQPDILTAVPIPYAKQLAYIAPDVLKLAKSYVGEGVTKLSDLITSLHGEVNGVIPEITEKDIQDILAGEYKQAKPTRNELMERMQDLRSEAAAMAKLAKLEAGIEPKSERRKIQRNRELADLRKQIREHDMTRLAETKRRMQTEIEKINKQLEAGDFSKPEKKQPVKLDPEAERLRDALIKAKQERERRILLEKYANMTNWQRGSSMFIELISTPRTIMASTDLSAVFRQALVPTVAHPVMASKAFKSMLKQTFSQKQFDKWMYDLENAPDYATMKESKLYISDPRNPMLDVKEEVFMNNLAKRIPVIGEVIGASERAYISYLNKMRVDLFRQMTDGFEAQGFTTRTNPELYKATADMINNMTGRGNLGKLEEGAKILNTVFFSPRLIASRLNLLTRPLDPTFYSLPKQVRTMYWKDMAKFLGAGATVLAIAAMSGADVETNPTSSDFGKIKFGDTRIDIWGGFQPYVRVMAQVLSGYKKNSKGELIPIGEKAFDDNRFDILFRFARGKLAPVPATVADMLSGSTIIGEELTPQSVALRSLTPLIIQDIMDASKDNTPLVTAGIGALATVGVGVQTYPATGWWKSDRISGRENEQDVNALGESKGEEDAELWDFLKQHKIKVNPQINSRLHLYDKDKNKMVKYTDEQYYDYVLTRGVALKNFLDRLKGQVDSGNIVEKLMTAKDSDKQPLFTKENPPTEREINLTIDRYVKGFEMKAENYAKLVVAGDKKPTEFFIKLKEAKENKDFDYWLERAFEE